MPSASSTRREMRGVAAGGDGAKLTSIEGTLAGWFAGLSGLANEALDAIQELGTLGSTNSKARQADELRWREQQARKRFELLPEREKEAMLRLRERARLKVKATDASGDPEISAHTIGSSGGRDVRAGLASLRAWGQKVHRGGAAGAEDGEAASLEIRDWPDVSPHWRKLGFQSSDPREDLRCGMLALDNLVYFCNTYPVEAEQLCTSRGGADVPGSFPMALASIKLTKVLAWYFSLLNGACPFEGPGSVPPLTDPSKVFAFAKLCADADAFAELHCKALSRLHDAWRKASSDLGKPPKEEFLWPRCLQETLAAVDEVLKTNTLETVLHFNSICDLPTPCASGS